MSDPGTRKADASQAEIEKRLRDVYQAAARDITERLDAHQRHFNRLDEIKRQKVEAGTLSREQYQQWLNGQVFRGKLWEDQVKSLTDTLLDANRTALRIIDGERLAVFGENATYQAYRLEHDANIDLGFTVYDSATVTRLIRNQPNLLPPHQLNSEKDAAWNRKTIASIIARGVLSGAKLEDIAGHLGQALGDTNRKSMLRYARTAMTAAQNAGRIEVLHEAQDMGIKVKKVWIATLDERTRESHGLLDGHSVDVDDAFSSILGPIRYPGDPAASADNTWNCRCTLGYEYEEYPKQNAERYDQEYGEVIEYMTYSEWKEWRNGQR